MIDSIAAVGPGFKGPSFYELKGPLLKNVVHEVNDFLLDIKNYWKVYGSSVMSDGWTNQKQQPIMNFLVYCPRGAMFLKSIDTSCLTKDAETLFHIFDSVVQEIGVEYIVQLMWCIWRERNWRTFEVLDRSEDQMLALFSSSLFDWARA